VVSWRGDLSSVQREEGSRRTRNSKRPKSAEKDVKEEVSSGSVTTTEYVVQPTGTLGLLSLSKPIPTVSPSPEKSSRRRTARSGQWRERRAKQLHSAVEFSDEEEDDDEEEEVILLAKDQPGVVTTPSEQPKRPKHVRTMSEPLSVTGGMDVGMEQAVSKSIRRGGKNKKKTDSADVVDGLQRLEFTPPVQEDSARKTSRRKGGTRGQKVALNPPLINATESSCEERAVSTLMEVPPSGTSATQVAPSSQTLSKSMPSGWLTQQEAMESEADGTQQKSKRTGGRKGRKEGDPAGEADVWEMPQAQERKGDGSGLTWQQMLAASPLAPSSNRKSARNPSSGTQTTRPNTRTIKHANTFSGSTSTSPVTIAHRSRQDLMSDGLAYSASEREDASSTALGRRRAPKYRGSGDESASRTGGTGTGTEHDDSDAFSPLPRGMTRTPLKQSLKPVISGSTVTPHRQAGGFRPAPLHTVSAPPTGINATVRNLDKGEVYAGPRFHNSPAAEALPAPRLLRG